MNTDKLEAIRARHEADCGFESDSMDSAEWRAALTMLATRAHADRATLLRLLDAAREELDKEQVSHLKTRVRLTRSREAALSALGLLDDPSCPVTGLDETRRARAILAEALKAPPTRTQGESS